jgi:predicted phage terminase large subunit-like protein
MYLPTRANRMVCSALQDVEEGLIKRLMIFMPPRNGKSMTGSETFPSYFIGKDPERRVILGSYGVDLAKRFGRYNRQKIEEFGEELFGVTLSKENSGVVTWDIEGHRGGMISSGIGGSITGFGADLLMIDDPVKNRQEADSEAYQKFIWEEWQNTLLTRVHAGGAIVIILTRWNEKDLAGRILAQEGELWTVVNLPAVAEKPDPKRKYCLYGVDNVEGPRDVDPLRRAEGECLSPELGYDLPTMQAIEKSVGSRTWDSLYQQRPSVAAGTIFKREWFDLEKGKVHFYTIRPDIQARSMQQLIQSWDMAFKSTTESARVAGQVWGKMGPDLYLIDAVVDKMTFTQSCSAVEMLTGKWPLARAKLIEDKANGTAVMDLLSSRIGGFIAIPAVDSKEGRANAASVAYEAGNIYLPHPSICPWIMDWIEEHIKFPNGEFLDQVDAGVHAVNRLFDNQLPDAPPVAAMAVGGSRWR